MGSAYSACESCFVDKANIKEAPLSSKTIKHRTSQQTNQDADNAPAEPSLTESTSNLVEKRSSDGANIKPVPDKSKKINMSHFDRITVLGRGSFGKVCLVRNKANRKYYALKTLKKEEIFGNKQTENANTEKTILQKASHPFVVKLHYSFQDEATLNFVMDYCPGGELFTHLKKSRKFGEATTQFYAAEVVLALQYLHEKIGIIYRDLKPENILIDWKGHIKITDFGLSKISAKGTSFCGTPEYLAPEVLLGQEHGQAVDYWSLGCLIFEMLAGHPPFHETDRKYLYRAIAKTEPVIPTYFSDSARDLISKLLVKDPTKRLGSNGMYEVKNHKFFASVNWEDVLLLRRTPPMTPLLLDLTNPKYFDKHYTNQPIEDSPVRNIEILKNKDGAFENFTYQADEMEKMSRGENKKLLTSKFN